jgi:hypothetical protein
MTGRRITGFLLAIAGAAGFTACMKSVLAGFRDVIKVDGGYCASGGPYVIAHQCSNADIRLLLVGIFGGLISVAVYAIGTAMLGKSAGSAGLLAWTALFGLLGWNFISAHGSVITGVLFLVMAAGGFVVLLSSVTSDLRNPRRASSAPAGMQPLVRAAVPPGFPNASPGLGTGWQQSPAATMTVPTTVAAPAPRGSALARTGAWLFATVAGLGLGIALSSALITALR